MTTLIDHSTTGSFCPSSDTEDELLLSPGKQEAYMRTNHSKRSASPPLDEYSPLLGSPYDNRKPKRVKRDLELEDSESDKTKVADVLRQRLAAGHARSLSDSDVLVGKRSTRKRSATSSKKLASSVIPSSSSFYPVNPTGKGRAQSVPLFVSFNDIPRIDFRYPPPSPKRSHSRSPSKDRELKFRISSTPFTQLSAIPETSSAAGMVGESGSTLKPTEVQLLPKIVEETQPTASINEIDPLKPLPPTQVTLSEVPCTPSARSLNKLIPMSPLTPLPESPFSARLITDLEDGSLRNTGWGVSSIEINASEQTTKPLLGIASSTSRSRLPRPSLVPPISDIKSSSTTVPFALPASKSSSSAFNNNKSNAKTAKKKEELAMPKQNAFTAIMDGQRMKQKAEKEQMAKVLHQGLKAGSSKSSQPLRPEKQKLTAKDRMMRKQREKPQRTALFVPDEEEEDSHSEAELTAPIEDQNRFVASSISPEPYISAQNVKTSVSEDSVMATRLETKVKSNDTIMLEQKALDDQMPLIGSIEETAAVPSEKVAEAAPPQPSPPPLLLEENASITNELTMLVPSESGTNRPKPGTSKLPRRKRRQLSSAPTVDRVTRSAILKQKEKADILLQPASTASVTKGQAGGLPVPAKRTASGSIKEPVPAQEIQYIKETSLPPGSPMKLSSPPKSTKSTAGDTEDGVRTKQTGPPSGKTPAKSRIPVMPSPSPAKLARTISRFSSATDISGLTRPFSMDENDQHTGAGSSLSTLSNALEKLRMPPPSRPNTSMGFNRDGLGDDDDTFRIPTWSKDDETVGRVSLGLGRSESGLKRAVTLGTSSFKSLEVGTDVSSSSMTSSMTKKPLVQKSLAMFMNEKAGNAEGSQFAAGAFMRGGMRPGLRGKGPSIFRGGLRRTISKKTSLPSVMASPVKGGGADGGETDEIMQDTIQDTDQDAQPSGSETVAAPTNDNDVLVLDDLEMQGPSKGKEKEKKFTFGFNPSRRVSMVSVSHSLSQSLNSLPPPQPKFRGLMGPPETPPASGRTGIRSSSSTYPSTSGGSPSQPETSIGTRSSARLAKTAPNVLMKIKGGTGGHVSSGRKGADEPPTEPSPVHETLKILNDCIIFVDVRTDDGDEAGSLFIDMLGGVGARVLTRVGQTCTHIVFKNGSMSTLTRYRMLRDPKPLVVGIAWVVECVEQRKRVDETKFLVDVEDMQYGTGTSKRRRSMLPRSLPSELPSELPLSSDTEREDGDADQSMDGSSSSMIIEILPPLELARRRKSMLLGPRP